MTYFSAKARDYERVAKSLAFITEHAREQPSLEQIAAHAGLSPAHFQRLFTRWAGIGPKQFLQSITIHEARALLQRSSNILDASFDAGLSGSSRLHDLFVTHEAMTPGAYRAGGEGLMISYGFHESPFGLCLVMATERGLAGIAFADSNEDEAETLADMQKRWPRATYVEESGETKTYISRLFDPCRWDAGNPLKLILIGGEFDISVWTVLLDIPMGCAVTYADIALKIGKPGAARAVGSAVGRNPISFAVPCHRVLRKDGAFGGYHWGMTRKRALIGWEAARIRSSDEQVDSEGQ